MRSPASSQVTRNRTITMMLFRLLRAIWWYIWLPRFALGPLHGSLDALGRPAAPDLSPDQPVAESRHVLGVVLEVIGPHGSVALVRHLALHLRRRLAEVVCRAGGRKVAHLPPAELQPVTKVEVLTKHEVARVEESDPVQRRQAQHQARAGAGVHLVHVGLRHVAHVVAPEAGALGEQPAQAHSAVEKRAGKGKSPSCVWIRAAIRQQKAWPDGAGVGPCEQEIGHPANRLWIYR